MNDSSSKLLLTLFGVFVFGYLFLGIIWGMFFKSPAEDPQVVEVVTPISERFDQPSARIFNKDSINPTRLVEIEQSDTESPFQQSIENNSTPEF